MNSCRRNIRKLAKICFFFSFWYMQPLFCLFILLVPLQSVRVSLGTQPPAVISLSESWQTEVRTLQPSRVLGFSFFFFFLRSEKSLNTKRIMEKLVQSDHQRARFSEEVLLLALWGCYGNSQKPKNKAINDFNRSMRKSFFPNEGCCLNPGRSNLNWTKEQTKEGLETCGRTNVWLRIVQQLKLTTLKPKLF